MAAKSAARATSADEHDGDAAVAVGEGGEHLADADEAGQRHGGDRGRPRRRAGALEDEHGQREPARPVAEQRHHVGEPEASEVPDAQRRQQRGGALADHATVVLRHRADGTAA